MRHLQLLRRIATSCSAYQQQASGASPGAQLEVFDGVLKAAQRDRAAHYPHSPDPLTEEVASRLVDRLEDCTQSFPRALILGGAGLQVLHALRGGRGGVESATLVDTSQGMLDRAQREWMNSNSSSSSSGKIIENSSSGADDNNDGKTFFLANSVKAEFVLADAEKEILPVDPGTFDVVISCLGLHWVNDVPGMMAQCRFALRPDGLFLGAMLGGSTLQELRIACTLAQQERAGGVSPRTSPLAQVRDAGNLLTRAGLSIPTVDVDEISVHYRDCIDLVEHLRKMGETNALIQRRESLPRDSALASAAAYIALFGEEHSNMIIDKDESSGNDEVESGKHSMHSIPATYQIVYLTGWAPDPKQPKAAKRGSATVSFEDLSKAMNK